MNKKRKLKNYRISKKALNNHKIIWNILHIITFIPLFPFAILERIGELLETIVQVIGSGRNNLIHFIFKLLYKNECNYYEEDEEKN